MNKKIIIILSILVVLVVAGLWFLGSFEKVSNRMGSGIVLEVKENSILAQGFLEAEGQDKKVVNVEFVITEKTVFKKTSLLIDIEKYAGKGPFTPEMVTKDSSFSEIKPKVRIEYIKTNDKLVDGGTAEALEIHYSTKDFIQK